ncbi:MAG: O-antigen ligase family protein [Bacteroidales bacterium]|nr:O-antigen ligase family protein [Bacteroidales bacterium]
MLLQKDKIALSVKYVSVASLMLYMLQGVLYPGSMFVAKIFLAAYFAVGIFCLTEILFSGTKQALIYSALAFAMANIAYFGFSNGTAISTFYGIDPQSPIKQTIFVFLTLFIFFYLSKNKLIDKKLLIVVYTFWFAVGIVNFYSLSPFSPIYDKEVNNSGYIFVNILPFLLFFKRKYIAIILFIISSIIVISSLKRGAILILIAIIAYGVFIWTRTAKLSVMQKISIFLFGAIICTSLAIPAYNSNDAIQNRMSETLSGYSSGRDIIYQQLLDNWENEGCLTNAMFGYGYSYTPIVTGGQYAHNDWLELLTNMGLFGVGLYMLFILQIVAITLCSTPDSIERRCMVSIILIIIVKSVFSMGYGDQGTIPLMILLGYVAGKNELQKTIVGL